MEDIILVGYGGHAKSVADTIERIGKYRIIGYTDVTEHTSPYPYLGKDDVLPSYYVRGIHHAAIGVGYLGKGDLRDRLYRYLKGIGFVLPAIIDPSAIVSTSASIDEGAFVGKCAIVNAEARIGRMAIINTKALIEHECIVGNYTHIAVGAVLCGQVQVGENSFIGANATIVQGIFIAPCSFVKAGSITKSIGYISY